MKPFKILFQHIVFISCLFIYTTGRTQNWDINLLRNINPQNPNSFVWKSFTSSAYPLSVATPVGIWIDGAVNHNKKTEYEGYEIAGSVIIAAGATETLKIIFNRKRPDEKYNDVYPYQYETGQSFPSGHASLAFATATSVSLEYKKWYIVVPAYAWAAGVSYSRLYLGEHYPTDIIGSAVTGAGSAVISHWISKKIFKQ
ncbi:MAG TPA: phosphatase PAP2 family protein [Parafilimonas sp.]|jgi:undecaprenyl-diphosphatase